MARPLSRLQSPATRKLSFQIHPSRHAFTSYALNSYNPNPSPHQTASQLSRLHQTHILRNHPSLTNTRQFSTISPKTTLRKQIRPFLIACHPDATPQNADDEEETKKRMSKQAKAVNLKAVQTINGLIEVCHELINRCTSVRKGQLPELKPRYEVEFMLPIREGKNELKLKKERREELSLRSIVIEFPSRLSEEVRTMALDGSSDEGYYVAMRLKKHVEREFMRLLTVAGLEHEHPIEEDDEEDDGVVGQEKKHQDKWTLSDHFLHELGIEPMQDVPSKSSAYYGRHQNTTTDTPPAYTHLQKERRNFINSIRWDKFRSRYDAAWEDAKADDATDRMNLYNPNTKEGRDRREKLVSTICSKVEIWMGSSQRDDDNCEEEGDGVDDIPEGLDVVAQLVGIRRLSTILLDNFEYLQLEKMGRMWENLVIVFTPPRNGRRKYRKQRQQVDNVPEEYADVVRRPGFHPGRKLNKWERKMKRRVRASDPPSRGFMRRVAEYHYGGLDKKFVQDGDEEEDNINEAEEETSNPSPPSQISESGFKFSYGSQTDQGTGQVTAYIPIDFGDAKVVRQLHVYLYDYFDNNCSGSGFLKIGPDGNLMANVSGVEDDDFGERARSSSA